MQPSVLRGHPEYRPSSGMGHGLGWLRSLMSPCKAQGTRAGQDTEDDDIGSQKRVPESKLFGNYFPV